MSSSVASPTVLLNRVLSLRESCPFLLVSDTFVQSASFLTEELLHKARTSHPDLNIVYLSFETACCPSYILPNKDTFVDLLDKDFEPILMKLLHSNGIDKRRLIIVDSFNYLPRKKIIRFLKLLMNPSHTVYGIYHQDIPTDIPTETPSAYSYLHFLSSCVFEIKPSDSDDSDSLYQSVLARGPQFPVGVRATQQSIFYMDLIYRRKSGRSLEYKFKIDSQKHQYESVITTATNSGQEDESLLKDLTTFNLGTTKKQKEQRDKVDLPFFEAQKSMGSVGASIVYEFEKDDDYDEEDPYEDPF